MQARLGRPWVGDCLPSLDDAEGDERGLFARVENYSVSLMSVGQFVGTWYKGVKRCGFRLGKGASKQRNYWLAPIAGAVLQAVWMGG